MFAGLINRAQATVDNAIGQIVNRVIIAVPFLVATGFATAYGYLRLQREYDSETATLVMALGFCMLGLFAALIFGRRSRPAEQAAESDAAQTTASSQDDTSNTSSQPILQPADKELLIAALSTAGPIALPTIVRMIAKNLPIVVALIALAFVLTRSVPEAGDERTSDAAAAPEPAAA